MGNVIQRTVCFGRGVTVAQSDDGNRSVWSRLGHSSCGAAYGPRHEQRAPGFVHGPRVGGHGELSVSGLQRLCIAVQQDD